MSQNPAYAWLALAAFLLSGCQQKGAGENALPSPTGSELPPPDVPTVASAAATNGASSGTESADGSYHATGTLQAREKAELAPKSSGVITKITVDEGDRVKKGQLLFRVDAQQAVLSVAQARAGVEAAQVALSSAELDLKRTKELFDHGTVAPAIYDQAKTQYDTAKVNLRQAQVAVSQAQRLAGDTAVLAPFSGVVTQKLMSEGEMATTTPPSVVLIIQDIDTVELRSRIPERALRDLAPHQEIEVVLPSIDQRRRVPITRINPTVDPRTRTVEVVAEIPNQDGALMPGMLAEVTFGTPSPETRAGAAPSASASKGKSP